MVMLALGSQWIHIRMRFDNAPVPKSRLIPVGTGLAGAGFFGWVALTTSWRTALTGSPTGDFTGIQDLFDVEGLFEGGVTTGSVIPEAVQRMIDTFPTVTGMWMAATMMLIVAAVGILIAGAGFKRSTGLRAGGVGFLVFAVLALIGLMVFVGSIAALLAAVENAFDTGGQGIGEAFASLAVAMVVKLVVVPFWAIVGFSLLALVGLRFALLRSGGVLLAPTDVKAIKRAGGAAVTAVAAPSSPAPGGDLPGDLGPAAPTGDVVVQLPAKEPEAPRP
jgi:hypothetical protein